MALSKHSQGAGEEIPKEKIAQEALEEARIVLPGMQTLFGFQLMATFTERFHEIAGSAQTLHYTALMLVALAIVLIMTPVAYHRMVERRTVTQWFIKLASFLIAAAMLPLMLALALEVYIVGQVILGSAVASAAAAGLFALTGLLWFAFPLSMRMWRKSGDMEG